MTGARLRQAGFDLRTASALTQGRLDFNDVYIGGLASALGVPSDELVRSLRPAELEELAFYRYSAEHSQAVWNVVLSTFPKLSDEQLADLTGINFRRISEARRGTAELHLTWQEAQRVAELARVKAADLFNFEKNDTR